MIPYFYTLGVYGLNSDQFFEKIVSNNIDTFIDIRRRRAVRGSEYVFVNSNRLQSKLTEIGINYIHLSELSPTEEIISIQKDYDKSHNVATRKRDKLSGIFISEYKKNILDKYDMNNLFDTLKSLGSKKALFFCVEIEANACHRSIITQKLHQEYSCKIIHL
jgi:uncharacterized protein (DUF488 family)